MDLEIKNKRALVCGGSSGLGLAIAMQLAEEGCDLILCSRTESKLVDAVKSIYTKFPNCKVTAVPGNLAKASDVKHLIQKCDDLGGLDILIGNSGGPTPSTAAETSSEAWTTGFQNLFLSFVELSQHFLPKMIENKFGRIIAVSSTSVVEPIANLAVSSSIRSAVTAYCKTLATEVARHGVTVNTVMPGVIHTERIEQLRRHKAVQNKTSFEEEMRNTTESIPAKRMGDPAEFAAVVAFLSSAKASYVTGTNITVDGGLRKSW